MTIRTLFMTVIIAASVMTAHAAEKNKVLVQCDLTRSAVDAAAGQAEGNKEALADLERARAALKQADDCYKAGKSFFGDISPETEKEVKISVDTASHSKDAALSRVELVRAAAELAAIEKQYAAVSGKLKLFEDRKAELDKLRSEAVAWQKVGKELETVKAEKAALAAQVEQFAAERGRADKLKIEQLEMARKLDDLKAENARLSGLLEKQQGDTRTQAAPAASADDLKKKSAR